MIDDDEEDPKDDYVPAFKRPLPAKRVRIPRKDIYNDQFHVYLANAKRIRPPLLAGDVYIAALDHGTKPVSHQARIYKAMEDRNTDPDTLWTDDIDPLAFAAKVNDDDTPSFREAMNGPDQAGFRKAMVLEWNQLLEKETWKIEDRPVPLNLKENIVGIQ